MVNDDLVFSAVWNGSSTSIEVVDHSGFHRYAIAYNFIFQTNVT